MALKRRFFNGQFLRFSQTLDDEFPILSLGAAHSALCFDVCLKFSPGNRTPIPERVCNSASLDHRDRNDGGLLSDDNKNEDAGELAAERLLTLSRVEFLADGVTVGALDSESILLQCGLMEPGCKTPQYCRKIDKINIAFELLPSEFAAACLDGKEIGCRLSWKKTLGDRPPLCGGVKIFLRTRVGACLSRAHTRSFCFDSECLTLKISGPPSTVAWCIARSGHQTPPKSYRRSLLTEESTDSLLSMRATSDGICWKSRLDGHYFRWVTPYQHPGRVPDDALYVFGTGRLPETLRMAIDPQTALEGYYLKLLVLPDKPVPATTIDVIASKRKPTFKATQPSTRAIPVQVHASR